MNTVTAKRSAVIAGSAKSECEKYEEQMLSHASNMLSLLFGRDISRGHRLFLVLLSSELATAESLITVFDKKVGLLNFLLDFYRCDDLKCEITTMITLKNMQKEFLRSRLLKM